jgi:hypothetical protein
MLQHQRVRLFLALMLFYGLVLTVSASTPFFWDTILTSTIADWFYQNGIVNLIPPTLLDAGHPVFFQLYLSAMWKVFGQNLVVSHWAMAPFLALLAWASTALISRLIDDRAMQWIAVLLIALHPFLLTQSTMVSYDIAMVAFFAAGLLAAAEKRPSLLAFAVLGISLLSIRGQLMGLGMVAGYLLAHRHQWRTILPAIGLWLLFVVGWNGYHLWQTGWMISSPSEHWTAQRSFANPEVVFRNIIGIARGFVDYGTAVLSITAILSGFLHFRKHRPTRAMAAVLIVSICTLSILVVSMLPFSNPIGHRYWMGLHLVLIVWTISNIAKWPQKWWMVGMLALAFGSGHWWLHPEHRSNGWDVTLAHLPYHENRKVLLQELEANDLSMESVASAFPLFCSTQQTDLSPGDRMSDLSEVDVENVEVLIYSPICNDISTSERENWFNSHHLVYIIGSANAPTRIEVYKRKAAGR